MTKTLPTPRQLSTSLDRHVYGQEDAKRTLCVAAYKHYLGVAEATASVVAEDQRTPAFGRQHTLLCGPTGAGKTLLVRRLADLLDVPVAVCRATSLVEAGYVGEQVESVVAALLSAAHNDVGRAERGIIFIDEIDKIRRSPELSRDVSGEGVQNALLALMDGTEVRVGRDNPTRVDTSHILFLCAGAFTGIDEIIFRRATGVARVGFGPEVSCDSDPRAQLTKQDLIEFGLIPEFVGRFANVRSLRELSTEDLAKILGEIEGSILARSRHYFRAHDIEMRFSKAAVRAVAVQAQAMGTGARGLDSVIGRVLEPLEWQLIESDRPIRRVVITAGTVLHGQNPRVTYDNREVCGQPAAAVLRQTAFVGLSTRTATTNEPIRFTNTRGWPSDKVRARLEAVRAQLDWDSTTGSARKWWEAFEIENNHRFALVLRLAEELLHRQATVTEFFLSHVYSNTNNIQANLHYLDYARLKKEEERKKKEAEAQKKAEEQKKAEPPVDPVPDYEDPGDDFEDPFQGLD